MSGRLPDPAFWRDRQVLLTGHTGFKGGWAALWLSRLGARVTGLALPPDTTPSMFELAGIARDVDSQIVDLRDRERVDRVVAAARPQIVIHMAAQALVRRALRDPVATVATNVLGTAHLLDAIARTEGVEAVLVVTSDKVYANAETGAAMTEADPLGGKDPYSASKAATEMIAASYAHSYLTPSGVPLAAARGGNVIGGGDFSEDRIVPDIVRAARERTPLVLRHPDSVRPWQYVLDCLGGYLVYCEALAGGTDVPRALNFGPVAAAPITVAALTDAVQKTLGTATGWKHEPVPGSVEARLLTLDSSLARRVLGWSDLFPGPAGVEATAAWYREWLAGADMRRASLNGIDAVMGVGVGST